MAAMTVRSLSLRGFPLALAAVLLAGSAAAQTMNANSASYNAGYGRTPDQENRAINADTRDANGNRVVINGVIQNGSDQSFFGGAASAFAGAGASASAGAGLGGATAIGNNLTVITQGSNNVVVVDSRQTNNGTVTATQTGVSGANGS